MNTPFFELVDVELWPIDIRDYLQGIIYSNGTLLCVDAIHIDTDLPEPHVQTWFINSPLAISKGDTLIVEQSTGLGSAFVEAVSDPYHITIEQHELSGHPYCKVLSVE